MGKVKAIQQTNSGKNIKFQDSSNHRIMTLSEFINRIESGNSVYSKDYYIKHDSSGKTPVSKPNGKKNDNLE